MAAIGALLISGCAAERAMPDASSPGPTFVSLNPCLDALLLEVAEPEQILALSHYSRDPAASSIDTRRARQFDVTGGTVEEVMALNPDIVLAGSFIAPATRSALEQLGMRVETFGSPTDIAESHAQIRRLSILTGHRQEGERLVRSIDPASADLRGEPPIYTLLWQPGQIVPGEQTLIGELLREQGFTSHSAVRGLDQGDYVALETLLADPPELLLVAGTTAGQRHPMLTKLKATWVEHLDAKLLYCGGPTITSVRQRLKAIREKIEQRNNAPLDDRQRVAGWNRQP